MKYGNCLLGAIACAIHNKFRGKFIILNKRGWKFYSIHLGWMNNGTIYHYLPNKYILPFPIDWIVFDGKIEEMNYNRIKRWASHGIPNFRIFEIPFLSENVSG